MVSDLNVVQLTELRNSHPGAELGSTCFVDPEENFPSSVYYRQTDLIRPNPWERVETTYSLSESSIERTISDYNENNQLIVVPKGREDLGSDEPQKEQALKFGTWDGVFTSCFLNIMGVIL